MTPFDGYCDDFYLTSYLNTELEMPTARDTVLHYFGQLSKAFPTMRNFYARESHEFVLEEDKDQGTYRWATLEPRRLTSGYFNPPSLDDCHSQHRLMLELATPLLDVSALDCEAIDVMFGFDFAYKGNHDEIIGETFAEPSKFGSLIGMAGARVIDFEPNITIALDEQCKLQSRLSIATRTNSYQVRTGQFGDESISVYFTVRQFWSLGPTGSFVEAYDNLFDTGLQLIQSHVLPNIVVPLHETIMSR